MPAPARQPPGQVFGVLGVVEHQQPPVPAPQLGEHRPPRLGQPAARVGAAQFGGQRRDLLPDQPRLLRGDPPHYVIAGGEPVRVLGRQLGLADPAHPVQRLHRRPVLAQQRLPDLRQHPVPAGEPGIAGRDISPHRRQHPRQPRPRPAQTAQRPRPRETRLTIRPGGPAAAVSSARRAAFSSTPNTSRLISGRSSGGTSSAGTSSTRTGTSRPAAPGTCASDADHSSVVYRSGSKYAAREQRHHPVRPPQRVVHRCHEVAARRPVPHIQLNGVPGIDQLPGRPLRPRRIPARMADEEINPVPAHVASIPRITTWRSGLRACIRGNSRNQRTGPAGPPSLIPAVACRRVSAGQQGQDAPRADHN